MRATARSVWTDGRGADHLVTHDGNDRRPTRASGPQSLSALSGEIVRICVGLAVSDDVAEERPDLLPVFMPSPTDFHDGYRTRAGPHVSRLWTANECLAEAFITCLPSQDGKRCPGLREMSRDSLKTSLHRLAIGPTRRGEAPLASTFQGCGIRAAATASASNAETAVPDVISLRW